MSIVRTILTVLIAVSVGMLPATAGAMAPAEPSDVAVSQTSFSPDMPADCDHHAAPTRGNHPKSAGGCATMAGCAVSCFNYAGTTVPGLSPAPTASRIQPIPATDLVVSNRGSPPFRPPRV